MIWPDWWRQTMNGFVPRTGICRRHIVTKETLTSMSVEASRRALEAAGIEPMDLDMIIVATLTPG